MYYGLITISVILFGLQFLFNNQYEREYGNHIASNFMFSLLYSLGGMIPLLIINGFKLEITAFTVIMAVITALNSILYTFFSLKALSKINLSLFSLFVALGGMLLPFFAGILFYDEAFTLGKGICVIVVTSALVLNVRKGKKKGGFWYCAGVFIMNGMSGVISKIFTSSDLPKASAVGYSVLMAMITVLLSGVAWFVMAQRERQRVVPAEEPSRAINKKVTNSWF